MIQHKNLTNALIYINTTLFTLLHSYMFRPSRATLRGSQHNVCPDAKSGSQNIFTWKLNRL